LNYTYSAADILLTDGDILEAGGLKFEIIHTPGHSPGGICIKVENSIFTGDTLFRNSIGRSDLGNGDQEELISSIKKKIMIFPDEIELYPGHGTASTIGYEREHNPYI
jgi:hydroxyacylglutathione hydrolase